MPGLGRLLKVGSMADSLGVYVPAMFFQKALSLTRVLLFTYLLAKVQFGLWGLGMMVFNIAAAVMTLGSSQGLTRYVSFYEVRGRLREFYRRIRWGVLGLGVALLAVSLACGKLITSLVITSQEPTADLTAANQLHVCWAALANGLMLALYGNLLGFLLGMRAYRLVSFIEVVFSVLFTASGAVAILVAPTAMSLLVAHLVSILAASIAGLALLEMALRRMGTAKAAPEVRTDREEIVMDASAQTEEITGGMPKAAAPAQVPAGREDDFFARVLRFGLVSLLGGLLWHVLGYVSFWITNQREGTAEGGVFFAFLSLGQLILFVANAVWAVVFSHVARWWERKGPDSAMLVLQAAYKAIALALLGLTIAAYLAAPLWVRILPAGYRHGQLLLGGLLLFFQTAAHLALMTILAKLYKRPVVIALAAVASGAGNVLLAAWLMGKFTYAPEGAAWAAGIGTYLGAGVVTVAYFMVARVSLSKSSYLVMATPALLLLPPWAAAAAWAGVCAAGVLTPWLFAREEKELIGQSIRKLLGPIRRIVT